MKFVYKSEQEKPLVVRDVRYHRNGSGPQEGFWAIRFDWPYEGFRFAHFIGIVFDKKNYIAVVESNDPEQRMRGSRFESELREVVKQYEAWWDPSEGRTG